MARAIPLHPFAPEKWLKSSGAPCLRATGAPGLPDVHTATRNVAEDLKGWDAPW